MTHLSDVKSVRHLHTKLTMSMLTLTTETKLMEPVRKEEEEGAKSADEEECDLLATHCLLFQSFRHRSILFYFLNKFRTKVRMRDYASHRVYIKQNEK